MILFLFFLLFKSIFTYYNEIINIKTYTKYEISNKFIYHYTSNLENYLFNVQRLNYLNIYYYHDPTKIKKHFNGSYIGYITKETGFNFLFNISNKDIYFIIEDSTNTQCYFYNYFEPYIINIESYSYKSSIYILEKINNHLKIIIKNKLSKDIYLNMYYENIQSLIAFKNNETIDILENPFIKLYSDSQYYIEYKLYYTAHLDLYFFMNKK